MGPSTVCGAATARSARMLCGIVGALVAGAVLAAPASAALSLTATQSLSEGGNVSVTVKRTTAAGALDVTVQGKSGTAKAADDFDDTAKTISFKPTELSKQVSIATVEDAMDEDPETFKIGVDSGAAGDPPAVEVRITDDDDPPSLTFATGTMSAPEGTGAAATPFGFEVKLSQPSGKKITVPYTVWDSGAIEPHDFTNGRSTLVIQPGSATATLSVPVVADNVDERDEKFSVEFGTPSHASLGSRTITWGTIVNDDVPTISVADTRAVEGSSGPAAMVFTVSLSNPSDREIYVNYETIPANGGASAADDFVSERGRITFSPGETSDTVLVWLNGDQTWEANESFGLTLSGAEGAGLARASAVGTIENDDAAPAAASGTTTAGRPPSAAARTPNTKAVSAGPATATRLSLTAPAFARPARVRTVVSCPVSAGSCKGTVAVFTVRSRRSKAPALRRRELEVGTARFTSQAGKRVIVSMRLSSRMRALLRQAGTIRVRAYLVVTDARGRVLTKEMLGTLRRR